MAEPMECWKIGGRTRELHRDYPCRESCLFGLSPVTCVSESQSTSSAVERPRHCRVLETSVSTENVINNGASLCVWRCCEVFVDMDQNVT